MTDYLDSVSAVASATPRPSAPLYVPLPFSVSVFPLHYSSLIETYTNQDMDIAA